MARPPSEARSRELRGQARRATPQAWRCRACRVHDARLDMVLQPMAASGGPRPEPELQNALSGKTPAVPQPLNGGSERPLVFRPDARRTSEVRLQRREQRGAGAAHPLAVPRTRRSRGNRRIRFVPPEVVEADHIHEVADAGEPINPPPKTLLLEHIPLVDRVAPHLAVVTEVVGRHTRLAARPPSSRIEVQHLRIPPAGRTPGHGVIRQISHDLHTPVAGVLPNKAPLLGEKVLHEVRARDLLAQFSASGAKRQLRASTERRSHVCQSVPCRSLSAAWRAKSSSQSRWLSTWSSKWRRRRPPAATRSQARRIASHRARAASGKSARPSTPVGSRSSPRGRGVRSRGVAQD